VEKACGWVGEDGNAEGDFCPLDAGEGLGAAVSTTRSDNLEEIVSGSPGVIFAEGSPCMLGAGGSGVDVSPLLGSGGMGEKLSGSMNAGGIMEGTTASNGVGGRGESSSGRTETGSTMDGGSVVPGVGARGEGSSGRLETGDIMEGASDSTSAGVTGEEGSRSLKTEGAREFGPGSFVVDGKAGAASGSPGAGVTS
jgi:hypothetical protein